MDNSIEKLIERYDGETETEYSAFLYFSSLSPKERIGPGITKKVSEYSGLTETSVVVTKNRHSWNDRALLIDAHNWMIENEKRQALLSKDNEHFIQENREVKNESLQISKQMLTVAKKLLQNAELVDDIIETGWVETNDGRRVATTTQIKMRAKVSDIPRLVETAVKVSRLAADLPTEILANDINRVTDLSNMTDEEIMELRAKNNKELLSLGVGSLNDFDGPEIG